KNSFIIIIPASLRHTSFTKGNLRSKIRIKERQMSEVQKKGEIIMTYLNDQYHDRGMKKWAGFFLSEHTAEQEKIQKGLAHTNYPKPQMSEQEIGKVLQIARIKNKSVAIQIEAIDNE